MSAFVRPIERGSHRASEDALRGRGRAARFGFALLFATLTAGPAAAVTAAFDWSMPDRLGSDTNGDGLADWLQDTNPAAIDPPAWTVDFDACASTGDALAFDWSVNGVPVATGTPCDGFSHAFPEEGVYQVALTAREPGGGSHTIARDVTVQDWLIVVMGDSVASGEGNPDEDLGLDFEVTWRDERCHRSGNSAAVHAAMALEASDPRTSVTLVNVACSGSTIPVGVAGPYDGFLPPDPPAAPLPPQTQASAALARSREVDAVVLNVGLNDLGFEAILAGCVLLDRCDLPSTTAEDVDFFFASFDDFVCAPLPEPLETDCESWFAGLASAFAGGFEWIAQNGTPVLVDNPYELVQATGAELPARFAQLAAAIDADLGVARDRVYLLEYQQIFRDETGALCESDFFGIEVPPGLGDEEIAWLEQLALTYMIDAGDTAAAVHGFQRVRLYDASRLHGYCASSPDRWWTRIPDSFLVQGDAFGALHPNAPGHVAGGGAIAADLAADLYPGGVARAPAPVPKCRDGLDNDGDGNIDFDGGLRALGVAQTAPDGTCQGNPNRDKERASSCGVGAELVMVLLPLALWRRRAGR